MKKWIKKIIVFISAITIAISQVYGLDAQLPKNIKDAVKTLSNKCLEFDQKVYKSCYSPKLGRAVYVEYIVDERSSQENIKNRPNFYNDKRIKKTNIEDYKAHSGVYDKGHLAFHAAFDYSKKAVKETYNLDLNIVPMMQRVNRHQWTYMERLILKEAKERKKVHVLDILTESFFYLNEGEVNIPNKMYKIITIDDNTTCYMVHNLDHDKNKEPYTTDCSQIQNMILN